MNNTKKNLLKRISAAFIIAFVFTAMLPVLGTDIAPGSSAASVTATGKVAYSDVNLRKSASTSSKSVATLKNGAKLTLQREVFTKDGSTAAKNRWYYVSTSKKSGYVRADMVKDIVWSKAQGTATDALNYRSGPSTDFDRLGTMDFGTTMGLLLPARMKGSDLEWYKANVGGKTAYVYAEYVRPGSSAFKKPSAKVLQGKSELARALLTNPTAGGKARVVYTFNKKNCKALFPIEGYRNAIVPQGFTFTGNKYYIVYGMAAGQGVVTYSASGQRLDASKFSFNIGHPNGITWDPFTQKCYIFKGNQKRIYTYNPATGKYGRSRTPYSSSGVGYDNATKLIYASSRTGIRAYSADGKFTHKVLFSRCSHGIFHYTQDCGAGEGFIFHGISGANKRKTNFVDIYRASDYAYLGSIKITIGEIESTAVGNDGHLLLLINSPGKTDYIWRTPLNVRELKF